VEYCNIVTFSQSIFLIQFTWCNCVRCSGEQAGRPSSLLALQVVWWCSGEQAGRPSSLLTLRVVWWCSGEQAGRPSSLLTLQVVWLCSGEQAGRMLLSLTANDIDIKPMLTYDLVSSSEMFAVDKYSGKLSLVGKLDYETQTSYNLTVMVRVSHSVLLVFVFKVICTQHDSVIRVVSPCWYIRDGHEDSIPQSKGCSSVLTAA